MKEGGGWVGGGGIKAGGSKGTGEGASVWSGGGICSFFRFLSASCTVLNFRAVFSASEGYELLVRKELAKETSFSETFNQR